MKLLHTLLLAAALALPGNAALAWDGPLATGQDKFLGSAFSAAQIEEFGTYWNKLTPENAGKWGEVEPVRGTLDWQALDRAYHFARARGLPFQMHVMVWGNQQPEWIKTLPPEEQLVEIKRWFGAVAERYPGLDYVEVVNEPLNDPPSKDDAGGGNYIEALGGAGASGWDWVLNAFRLAREHFPHAKLLLNDYNVIDKREHTEAYLAIVRLLQKERLVDGLGVQAHAFETHDTTSAELRANLDLLAATGLPIYITEMDIDGPTDATQLAEYQRVFPLFWQHPGVRGITLWGFRPGLWREKEHAELLRADGSERPALQWLRQYLHATPRPDPA